MYHTLYKGMKSCLLISISFHWSVNCTYRSFSMMIKLFYGKNYSSCFLKNHYDLSLILQSLFRFWVLWQPKYEYHDYFFLNSYLNNDYMWRHSIELSICVQLLPFNVKVDANMKSNTKLQRNIKILFLNYTIFEVIDRKDQ